MVVNDAVALGVGASDYPSHDVERLRLGLRVAVRAIIGCTLPVGFILNGLIGAVGMINPIQLIVAVVLVTDGLDVFAENIRICLFANPPQVVVFNLGENQITLEVVTSGADGVASESKGADLGFLTAFLFP